MRLLCGSKRENRKPIEELLQETWWLSINQLSCEIRLIEVWKSLNLENYCLKYLLEYRHKVGGEWVYVNNCIKC